ncbi:MAG TPA: O-methyltransferase [Anaerolineales bacterium]|nr:O-methyltransferase [Anaerolineales bacterium]
MGKDQVSRYITGLFAVHDLSLQEARESSPKKGLPAISIQPEEGRFLQFLVRANNTKKALEIGTLGGYSGIWIARGLPPGGKLITLEFDSHHAQIAREHFEAAGVADLIEVRVGDAHSVLQDLSDEDPFDFVFIDADKSGYETYYEWAVENVPVGGVITAHNTLRGGKVADDNEVDKKTCVMRSFNSRVAKDPRVISTIYPAGDGTLVAVRIA